ncbi:MAG: hypothetical protein KatS3mg121_0221 [Gammaproteobacteria bacterium]|nr:MAG: hypothetical protein KatS3mg121_0221 [Gammaproteobacteria bacterium]
MSVPVDIGGLVVYLKPGWFEAVRGVLQRWPGVDIAAADPAGKLVLVVEAAGDGALADVIERLQALDGVLQVALAYHHRESSEALDEVLE